MSVLKDKIQWPDSTLFEVCNERSVVLKLQGIFFLFCKVIYPLEQQYNVDLKNVIILAMFK